MVAIRIRRGASMTADDNILKVLDAEPQAAQEDVPEYRLQDQIGFLLRKAQQRHVAIFAAHIPEVTPPQFAALAKLGEVGETSQNQLGALVEVLFGTARLAAIYFASGLAGSLASVAWDLVSGRQQPSVGASGAIFGLLGALIAFLLRHRDRLRPEARSLLLQLLFWAGINIVFGFTADMIDNAAHLGGLAAGLAIGATLRPAHAGGGA